MRVRVLGDLVVEEAGLRLDLGGPKPRALLALLVAAQGRPLSTGRLVDEIWGEEPPDRVQASVQSYVARLRRALEPDRVTGGARSLLRTVPAGYALELDDEVVDARRFARLVDGARETGSVEVFEEALGLWSGPAYAGLVAPTLEAEAVRLEELRLAAAAELWGLRLARGEHHVAVPELEHLVRLHPLRERLWGLLATALYRDARQGDALAAVRRAREHLADALGVDPGPELRALEERILKQDPALALVPASIVVPAAPRADEVPEAAARPSLVGREDAVAQVEGVLCEARAGRGRVVLVSGEPGIGKSRLSEELRARAHDAGFRTGRGGWEAEPCPALWGWERAVEQALGDVSALEADGSDATSVAFQRGQNVLRTLGQVPTLLVLEDLHWADGESLRLLGRVAAGIAGTPAVLVLTVRNAAGEQDALQDTLAGVARTDPLRLELRGLARADVAAWVSRQGGRDAAASVVAELTERTGGNPLYLVELTRYLLAEGALEDLDAAAWTQVPTGVREVVRHQTAELPAAWVEVLVTAATVGRNVDLALLEQVHADQQVVWEAVEAAQLRGLVDETTPGTFRFTHALVRDALYETLSTPAKARIHAEVAAAGEVVYAGRIAEHAAELAEHYRRAGRVHVRSAWVLARTAAAYAEATAAHDEVVRWYRSAADLQRDDATVLFEEREGVLTALARGLVRVAHPVASWAPAAAAAVSALDRGRPERAAESLLTVTEGLVWGWRPAPSWDEEGIALWRRLLEAHPEPTLRRAQLMAALSTELLYKPASAAESTRLADGAVEIVRRLGGDDPVSLGILRLAHTALLRPDLVHHRSRLGDEIVELATRLDDRAALAASLVARAHDRTEVGRLEDAWSDVTRSREIAQRENLPESLIVGGWVRASLLLAGDDPAAAEAAAEECQALQQSLRVAATGIDLGHLAMVRDAQDRMHEVEGLLRGVRHHHPALRELHALSMVRTGDLARLRAELGAWSEQPEIPEDYSWLMLTAIRAEVWITLRDAGAAADLYARLAPYADRLAATHAITVRGSVAHWLGRLAALRGDGAAARAHLERALATHQRLGMGLWVRRTREALVALP